MVTPESVLDPRSPVLAAVFSDSPALFPQGARASSAPWLDILGELGMKSTLDSALALRCARHIVARAVRAAAGGEAAAEAAAAARPTGAAAAWLPAEPELALAAGRLLTGIRSTFELVNNREFCEQLSQMPIVPVSRPSLAYRVLQTDWAADGASAHALQGAVLARFRDCSPEADGFCVWTQRPIVHTALVPDRVRSPRR